MKHLKMVLALVPVVALIVVGSGCGQATSTAATGSEIDPASTTEVKFEVEGMNCAVYCKATVENALFVQPGVADVQVDFDTKIATCTVDPEQFNADKAIKALDEASYPGKLLAADSIMKN